MNRKLEGLKQRLAQALIYAALFLELTLCYNYLLKVNFRQGSQVVLLSLGLPVSLKK